ncbi:hypothetical protein ACMT9Y_15285 [Clavibacter tessellarius]|uniref:hypothetical protein n=1 Tax=Clavibacter tessellarius TaxID=31965 RepID=UPI0039EACC6A
MVFTQKTHNGTLQDRRRKRSRWAARQRLGTDVFLPYRDAAWEQIQAALSSNNKSERKRAGIDARRMRANPDGSDGMGWLQFGANMPGIAWHAPIGESPYLSVAFSVSGQLRGMETKLALRRAAMEWGAFLAHHGSPSSLIRNVQTLTRVLPPDTAKHDIWYDKNREPRPTGATPKELELYDAQQASYAEVRRRASKDSMVQRHFVVLSWPLTPTFAVAAEKFGPGRDGWRELMAEQIAAATYGLEQAKMGQVSPLTARQTAALIMHQQNPSIPIDMRAARHINPLSVGIGSHDEYSAHVVDGGYDPTVLRDEDLISAAPAVTWWHRTAAIHGEDLATAGRSPLWTLDLMIGRDLGFIRSISFHMNLVPASEAKAAARQDVVRDSGDVLAQKKKGVIVSDESDLLLGAAERRRQDLAAGSKHHGVSWIGYVTVSAATREDLAQASRRLESVCDTGLGIDRLDWQDSFQSAASGTTWPIGRGLKPNTQTSATRIMNILAGRGDKEALS